MSDQAAEYHFAYYLDDDVDPSGLFVAVESKNKAIMSARYANSKLDWNEQTERLTYLRYKGETLDADLLSRDEAVKFSARLGRDLDTAENLLRKSWESANGTALKVTPPDPSLLQRRGGEARVHFDEVGHGKDS